MIPSLRETRIGFGSDEVPLREAPGERYVDGL